MRNNLTEEIAHAAHHFRNEMTETLRQLVRIPSVTGQEGKAQEFIRKEYEKLGIEVKSFEADRHKIQNHPAFNDSGLSFSGRPNIIGILQGDRGKKSLILNGHVDTASPEPIKAWTRDPWGGDVEGARLYGNGAMDMKAGCVANIFALKILERIGVKPQGSVLLQSVIEEEAGGGGTLSCLLEGYTADGMLISEPYPFVCIARAGLVYFRIKVEGKTAHGGRAHFGVNAIGKMLRIYQALEALDEMRGRTVRFPLLEKWSGRACNLSTSRMSAGSWIPSTVAGTAELEGRISFIPGESRKKIKELLEETVHQVAEADPWLREHPPIVEYFSFQTDPEYWDAANPFVTTVSDAAQEIFESKIELQGRPSAADTRFAQYFGFPAVTFGPAGENPHGADEFVDLDSLEKVTQVIALVALDWCST